jgi:hypothetical protein
MLYSHLRLGLSIGLFPSGFRNKTLHTPLHHPRCMSPHLILLDFINCAVVGEDYRSLSSSLWSFLHSTVISSLLVPNIPLNTIFPSTLYSPQHYIRLNTIFPSTLYSPQHYIPLNIIFPSTLYSPQHYISLNTIFPSTLYSQTPSAYVIRIPIRAEDLSLFQNLQRGSGVHTTTYSAGTGRFSPTVKRSGRETDHSNASSTDVNNEWNYTSTPFYAHGFHCLLSLNIHSSVIRQWIFRIVNMNL